MKNIVLIVFFFFSMGSLNAQNKFNTEKVFLITLDGLRWQEVFSGVDSTLMNTKEYTKEKEEMSQRFWDNDPQKRRAKLMPFFWSTIAQTGQLLGNRNHDNKVNVTNTYWFLIRDTMKY